MQRLSKQVQWLVEAVVPILVIWLVIYGMVWCARQADMVQALLGGGS